MRAAAQAQVASYGNSHFGINISNHSGHFLPNGRSVSLGVRSFRRVGVEFSNVEIVP